ncbi:hypothetical protein Tco_0842573 [Tanacetum coccineum]|uniref:Uncharacterized protein n=1 Tax=Tanacetum coccineum TaxID=301880 RepID=A0ABQ5B0I8_9ASTR
MGSSSSLIGRIFTKITRKEPKTRQKQSQDGKSTQDPDVCQQRFEYKAPHQQREASSKANDWLSLTQGMPRVLQRSTTNLGLYTKISAKEAQKLQESGNATLAIRVPLFHPTANIQDPMIKRDQWPRLEAAKEQALVGITIQEEDSSELEGLKYSSNIGQNNKSQSFFVGGTLGVGEGGCGRSRDLTIQGMELLAVDVSGMMVVESYNEDLDREDDTGLGDERSIMTKVISKKR